MKAQLQSDHHTEFYHGNPWDMLASLEFEPDLDFLLLPGDLIVPAHQSDKEMHAILEFFSNKARHVLYTFGNHEYYSSTNHVEVENRILSVFPENFHLLHNSEKVIEGKIFFGGAMWFPDHPLNYLYERQLNDFNLVKDIHDWVYLTNAQFRLYGQELIRPETVVLTHHLPSDLSTPEMYKGSDINRFFISDETALIMDKKPRLWVHGHTHHSCDYVLGETRVVCHPYGYPKERMEMGKYKPVVFEL
jgi:predicted MPP superfamily phosphohydrolase